MDTSKLQNVSYPILPTWRSIRILRLMLCNNNEAEDLIRFTLEVVDLDERPCYQALSYTWGHPIDPKEDPLPEQGVVCNGIPIRIGNNLYNALYYIRERRDATALWVDAVCINQKNTQERNCQVALMYDIYGRATRTIVWLGIEDEHFEPAMKLVNRLAPVITEMIDQRRIDELHDTLSVGRRFLEKIGPEHISFDWWQSYDAFSLRTWFSRVWVIQEIAMAQDVLMLCGVNEVPWKRLEQFTYLDTPKFRASLWAEQSTRISHVSAGPWFGALSNPIRALVNVLRYRIEGEALEKQLLKQSGAGSYEQICYAFFQYLLDTIKPFRSSDPRDMIYSILGLMRSYDVRRQVEVPHPDYDLSAADVWTAATARILIRVPTISILSWKREIDVLRRVPDLPSWVPDFSILWLRMHQTRFVDLGHLGFYNASRSPSIDIPARRVTGNTLFLNATQCGIISGISRRLGGFHCILEKMFGYLDMVPNIDALYINGQSKLEALWRTLIADQEDGTAPAPERCGQLFCEALCSIGVQTHRSHMSQFRDLCAPVERFLAVYPDCGLPSINDMQVMAQTKREPLAESQPMLKYSNSEELYIDTFMNPVIDGRNLFRTNDDLLGLCPQTAEEEDSVWIIHGAKVPYILRSVPGSDSFRLIGEAYLHGFMQGEIFNSGKAESREIAIV